jgi:hypothetical protein
MVQRNNPEDMLWFSKFTSDPGLPIAMMMFACNAMYIMISGNSAVQHAECGNERGGGGDSEREIEVIAKLKNIDGTSIKK